jgi:HAD superfamily hydrolase (TIGR01509 family)
MDVGDMEGLVFRMIGLRSDASKPMLIDGLAGRHSYDRFIAQWHRRIERRYRDGIPLRPGVRRLLEQLEAQNTPCAVATSTRTQNAVSHLEIAGIRRFFQTVTGGELVEHGKPAPDIYHAAAASLGLSAADCVAFEDSDPGTRAAIAAGACTVQIPDINAPAPDMHALGHRIAPDILTGARETGLIPVRDRA